MTDRARPENKSTIMGDPFIQSHMAEVMRSLRTQWILDIIRPYTRVELAYLASSLGVDVAEVEEILVALILDHKVSGRLDQVKGQLELDQHKHLDERRYASLDRWADEVGRMQRTIVGKSAQVGGPSLTGAMVERGMEMPGLSVGVF
jgi:COP9 signalosome complex subunit 2